jgi:hypothetical protein
VQYLTKEISEVLECKEVFWLDLGLLDFSEEVDDSDDDIKVLALVMRNKGSHQLDEIDDVASSPRIEWSALQLSYHLSRHELTDVVAVVHLHARGRLQGP